VRALLRKKLEALWMQVFFYSNNRNWVVCLNAAIKTRGEFLAGSFFLGKLLLF